MPKTIYILFVLGVWIGRGFASGITNVWCYQCVSTQPGCGAQLNWFWHWTKICPEENDVCVKIIEERQGEKIITRDCLSSVQGIRVDIPADHYEGCRPATVDPKLANYVNNSIKELDIHRNYYDNTTWCFCFLDYRCNSAFSLGQPQLFIFGSIILTIHHILIR